MVALPHLAFGAVCGVVAHKKIKKEFKFWTFVLICCLAGFAGIISHIILDAIRHEEYLPYLLEVNSRLIVFIGLEVLVAFGFAFSRHNPKGLNWTMFFGMSGAAFPDLARYIHYRFFVASYDILHTYHSPSDSPFEIPLEWQLVGGLVVLAFYIWPKRQYLEPPD